MSIAKNIAYHRANGHISIDRYVNIRTVELGRSLDARTPIYLDIKFWILLRNVALGRDCSETGSDLMRLLRDGVANRKLLCPASESVFLELLKQTDASTRMATARLIDELSLGVTLLHNQARSETEVAHFIHSVEEDGGSLHPLRHLVWSKLSYVLGVVHPSSTPFDPDTERALQKAFFDHMWTIPLATVVDMIKEVPDRENLTLADIAAMLNDGAARHAKDVVSFERVLSDELRGVADLCADTAVEVASDIGEKKGGAPILRGTPQWTQCRLLCASALFHALVSQPEARLQLRTLYIEACLHAAVRWNKTQRFTGNDLYDFNHASAGLGYCAAFFTDDPLRHLVASNNIALDRLFGCHVVSGVPGAIAFLRTLGSDDGAAAPELQRSHRDARQMSMGER
jgi:predicted DNA-binding ribbon-helix-helix protein